MDRILRRRQHWRCLVPQHLDGTILLTNFNNGGNNGAFIGGGQIGANYQIGQFVVGGEWDGDWAANNNNSAAIGIPGVGAIAVTSNNRWITTVAA